MQGIPFPGSKNSENKEQPQTQDSSTDSSSSQCGKQASGVRQRPRASTGATSAGGHCQNYQIFV
jgi:hypothetical protein